MPPAIQLGTHRRLVSIPVTPSPGVKSIVYCGKTPRVPNPKPSVDPVTVYGSRSGSPSTTASYPRTATSSGTAPAASRTSRPTSDQPAAPPARRARQTCTSAYTVNGTAISTASKGRAHAATPITAPAPPTGGGEP